MENRKCRSQNKWGLVKQAYVREKIPNESPRMESIHSLTFGSNMKYIDELDDLERPEKGVGKMSFFKAVTEAKKLNNKRKRPTLLNFLDKFQTMDVPEDVTPNYSNSHFFSHFDDTIKDDDEDTLLLKKSLKSLSGESRELASPKYNDQSNDWKTVIISIAGKEFRTRIKISEGTQSQDWGK